MHFFRFFYLLGLITTTAFPSVFAADSLNELLRETDQKARKQQAKNSKKAPDSLLETSSFRNNKEQEGKKKNGEALKKIHHKRAQITWALTIDPDGFATAVQSPVMPDASVEDTLSGSQHLSVPSSGQRKKKNPPPTSTPSSTPRDPSAQGKSSIIAAALAILAAQQK